MEQDKVNESDTNGLKKGQWSTQEDEILAAYVKEHGEGNWNLVSKNCGLARCGKSCRFRWLNHLKSDLKRGPLSIEEKQKIIRLYDTLGPKWSKMAIEVCIHATFFFFNINLYVSFILRIRVYYFS